MKAKEHNRRMAPGKFRVGEFKNPSKKIAYRVYGYKMDGARIRENFKTHDEALARKQTLEVEAANVQTSGHTVFTKLTAQQVNDAEIASSMLEGLGDWTFAKVARFFLDNYREPVTNVAVKLAFDKFIKEKTAANLRPHSIQNLKSKAKGLLDNHGEKPVANITTETVRELIFKESRGSKARDNYRRALHGFFAWSHAQGYCAANPVTSITPIKVDRIDPVILTPEQVTELLDAAHTHKEGSLVPYVALAVFAGLRPTELSRLTWDKIDIRGRAITIGSDMAKMRSKRIVTISDNLRAFLAPFASKKPEIVGQNWRRDFDAVKLAAGYGSPTEDKPKLRPWTQDVLRHTAISYHLAKYQHEGKTAGWAGNSPDMIQKHYKGLVKAGAAKKFWSIRPEPSGKVVRPNFTRRGHSQSRTVAAHAQKVRHSHAEGVFI
jgi:integrase